MMWKQRISKEHEYSMLHLRIILVALGFMDGWDLLSFCVPIPEWKGILTSLCPSLQNTTFINNII